MHHPPPYLRFVDTHRSLFSLTRTQNSTPFDIQLCLCSRWPYVPLSFAVPMTRVLASDLQGHRERPDDLPAFEKVASGLTTGL
jgi:hypothetical protein